MTPSVLVAAALGFFIGAVLVWIIKNTNQSGEQQLQEEAETLRKERDALKQSYARFRSSVNSHFARTADAVDQLTDSYKNVFNQLSEGAQHLMDKEALKEQLDKRRGKTVTLSYLAAEKEAAAVKPAEAAKPAPAAKTAEAAQPAAADPRPIEAVASDKNETPQEAVKRHLHNNREQRL